MKLLKNGRIGKICKLSAIVIVLIGIAHLVLQIYSTWMTYQSLQDPSGQQFGSSLALEYYSYLMPNVSSALESVTATIFYAVILYVTGVIITAYFGPTQKENIVQKDDETAITYEPLDDDKVIIENIDRRR